MVNASKYVHTYGTNAMNHMLLPVPYVCELDMEIESYMKKA